MSKFSEIYKKLNTALERVDDDNRSCYTDTVAFLVKGVKNDVFHHPSYVCFGWTGNRPEYRSKATKYLAFHVKDKPVLPDGMEAKWLDYIINRSPWVGGISNTVEDILETRLVLGNATVPSNIMYAALFSIRMMYERKQWVAVFNCLVDAGVSEDTAFLLCMSCVSDGELDYGKDLGRFRFFVGATSHSDHMPLYMHNFTRDDAKNFYSRRIQRLQPALNSKEMSGIYNVCAMFRSEYPASNQPPQEVLDFVKDNWPSKKPKKVTNNPFLKTANSAAKLIPFNDLIPGLIEVAPLFEKEFMPNE